MKKFFLILSLFAVIGVYGEDFEKVIKATTQNNLNVKKAYFEMKKAEKLYKKASLEKAPSMKIQKIRKDVDEAIPTPSLMDKKFDVDKFIMSSPLYVGGKLEYARKINGIALEIAKLNYRLIKENSVFQVIEDYFAVMKLLKMLEVSEDAREILNVHLKDVESYFKNGLALDSDLLKIKVRISDVDKQIIELKNNIALIKERIIKNTGINPEFNAKEQDITLKKHEIAAEYLKFRPEYEIMVLNNRIGDIKIKVAEGEWKPSVYFTYENYSGHDFNDNDSGYSTSIVAEWKFYDFGKSWAGKQAEEYSKKANDFELEDVSKSLILEINCSKYNVEKSEALKNVSEIQVANSKRNLEILKEQFKEGIVKNTDFLDAQLEYTKSEMEYSSALYDLYVDKYKYLKSMGSLNKVLDL
ncbi:MAG: TolC family protein [Candidatus Muirbacterium halophilum]|nr:TolC family protein [Candidatus Muirbacterium halophilum]MCK9474862.1 TolC family protein [Candidatus Muirbacterium halophilum]